MEAIIHACVSDLLVKGHASFPAVFLEDFVNAAHRVGSLYILLGRVHVERHRIER